MFKDSGEWRVEIIRPVCSNTIEFWLFRPTGYGDMEILGPDGRMHKLSCGAEKPANWLPTLKLNQINAQQIMNALAKGLEEQGVKTPDIHILEGKVVAQEAHLQDLRKILKLK